ncbi:MAG TPA: transcriptional regulator [Caulobacteraceae bacterium]|jgi:DNA-binding winged helix-turn-helix (wHTH) protein/tetratricopeptide (TPR) repeat protein|nr:transcriptional regulator [Caulobacteraceae bacterium]
MERQVFGFAGFELEPRERRLSRAGRAIALTPKVFDLLVLLVEHAGHVLTKDDLLEGLWPGRLVTESNLTKHMWLLRKALGEEGEELGLIETVSKVGYRFRAPVTCSVAPAEGLEASPVATPFRARVAGRASWIAGAAVLTLAALAVLIVAPRLASPPFAGGTDKAVSVVTLDNLSRDARAAWIGPALVETLGTEIGLGAQVHVTPGDLAKPVLAGFPLPGAGGYAAPSLAALRTRLGADYVLSGGYLVSSDDPDAPIRLDLTLQATRGGAVINFTRSGKVSELPALVAAIGADLRRRLGAGADRSGDIRMAANLEAPSIEVMRRVGVGLEALRRHDAAGARDEFLEAVAQAPGYAPAYAWLSQAWSAMGYQAKARAAAEQAAALDAGLPEPVRLAIEAQRRTAEFDWTGAAQALRRLITLRPGDPEPRLQLISVLLSAGQPDAAGAALAGLRALQGSAPGDARLELAAATIAAHRDDDKARADHAARALTLARAAHEPGLAGNAETQLAVALEGVRPADADRLLRQAVVDYAAIGDPHGQAWARQNLGNLWSGRNPARARTEYALAMTAYQNIGDEGGVAAIYSNLGDMMWTAGDRDGAETAARHVLDIRQKTDDVAGQAWAWAALAIEKSDEADDDEVLVDFRRAVALDHKAGAHAHLGFTLLSLSDDLRLRGELAEAAQTCAQAQSEYAALGDAAGRAGADFECAQIALDRGDVVAAEAGVKAARAAAQAHGDTMTLANADLLAGQIALGERHAAPAAVDFETAAKEFTGGGMTTGQALAASFLALADQALGRPKARDAAAAEARALRSRITERQEVFAADIAVAQLDGETGSPSAADAALQTLAASAAKRGWVSLALEARLAAIEVLAHPGDGAHARALRQALTAEARRSGFNWILRRLG